MLKRALHCLLSILHSPLSKSRESNCILHFSIMGKIKRERQKFHITATADDVEMNNEPVRTLVKSVATAKTADNIFAGIDIKLDNIHKFVEPAVVIERKQQPQVKPIPYKKTKSDIVPVVNKLPAAPERQLTKKEKQRLKHDKLLQKIDIIQQAKQRTKKKRSKQLANDSAPAINVPSASAELKSLNKKIIDIASKSNQATPKKKAGLSLRSLEDALPSVNDSLPSLDSVLRLQSKNAKTGLTTDQVDSSDKNGKKHKKLKVKGKKINKPNKTNELLKQFNHYQKLLSDEAFKINPRAVISSHIRDKLRNRKEFKCKSL